MCCLGYLEGEGYAVGVLDLDGNWVVKPFPLEKASSPEVLVTGYQYQATSYSFPWNLQDLTRFTSTAGKMRR